MFPTNNPVLIPPTLPGTTGAGTVATAGVAVTGSGTSFMTAFVIGGWIVVAGQTRTILSIPDNTHLTVSIAFSPDLPAGTAYTVGGRYDVPIDAVTAWQTPVSALMNVAANDLAANRGTTGILLPCYIYPAAAYTNATYNSLLALKRQYRNVPLYVILNPSNGPGGSTDGNFTAIIDRLHSVGAVVLAYVHTSYGTRPLADVLTDVSNWQAFYPRVDGLFVDECANNPGDGATAHSTVAAGAVSSVVVDTGGASYGSAPLVTFSGGGGSGATAHAVLMAAVVTSIVVDAGGAGYTTPPTVMVEGLAADLAYYNKLYITAKTAQLNPVVANPGADQIQAYYDGLTADVFCIYENSGWPVEATLKGDFAGGHASYPWVREAALAYNVVFDPAKIRMMREYCGMVLATDGNLPNPWNALPTALESLFQVLAQPASGMMVEESFTTGDTGAFDANPDRTLGAGPHNTVTVSQPISPGTVYNAFNGRQPMVPTDDFTVSGQQFTFLSGAAPINGEKVRIQYVPA